MDCNMVRMDGIHMRIFWKNPIDGMITPTIQVNRIEEIFIGMDLENCQQIL